MPTRMREAAFCLGPDETLQQCKAELFDRYGRRATSRRKFSIRDFDAARIASPPVDSDAQQVQPDGSGESSERCR